MTLLRRHPRYWRGTHLDLLPADTPANVRTGSRRHQNTRKHASRPHRTDGGRNLFVLQLWRPNAGNPPGIVTAGRECRGSRHYKVVLEPGTQGIHHSVSRSGGGRAGAAYTVRTFFCWAAPRCGTRSMSRLSGENAECVLNGLLYGRPASAREMETHTLIDHIISRAARAASSTRAFWTIMRRAFGSTA